jgi:outer membrane protein assembly factor BamD
MNRVIAENKLSVFLLLTFSMLFVVSCGSKKVPKDMNDEQLYEAAVEELQGQSGGFPWIFGGRDFDTIFKLFKEVQLRYTYSPYATLAELRTADTYFERGEYETAAIEYEEFLKRHPGHKEVAYATYRLALSFYKEIRSPDRDPTFTREALKWFTLFVDEYPGSPLVPDAEQRMQKCRDRLAKREIMIGNFYNKRKNYNAAAGRYLVVVSEYPNSNKYQEALYLLGRAYAKSERYELARNTLNQLVQEYPDQKYSGKASSILNNIEGKSAPPPEEEQIDEIQEEVIEEVPQQ